MYSEMKAARARRESTLGRASGVDFVRAEKGFTLPMVVIVIALSVSAITSVAFLATHFRTVARAEDDERLYYALDAALELVLADLVRGADVTAVSYAASAVLLNDVSSTTIAFSTPSSAGPVATQQYFDPGVTNPELLTIPAGNGYLLHILSAYPSQGTTTSMLEVNWAITLVGTTSSAGGVTIKLFDNKGGVPPGRTSNCPTGAALAQTTQGFSGAGVHSLRMNPVELTASATYSLAFCLSSLNGSFTTNAYKPTGGNDDTWVYAIAFKDYEVKAQADGASVTATVRQVPGPMQPPDGDWADDNISWITNVVTPYEWRR